MKYKAVKSDLLMDFKRGQCNFSIEEPTLYVCCGVTYTSSVLDAGIIF
jgi:hypothetical protein